MLGRVHEASDTGDRRHVCGGSRPARAGSGIGTVVADWEMNEGSKPTPMIDSSGNKLNGSIGSRVTIHTTTGDGGFGYSFPGVGLRPHPADDGARQREAGPGDAAVRRDDPVQDRCLGAEHRAEGTVRAVGRLLEAGAARGMAALPLPGRAGHTKAIGFVDGPTSLKANDNAWHVVRCERTSTGVRITMDPGQSDSATKFIRGTIGNIDNKRPFSIGGKVDCGTADVGCDYFRGQIDWIRVERP